MPNELTAERLREALSYDRASGEFIWLIAPRGHKAGIVAGTLNADGYCQIKIDGRTYYAHRLAFLYVNGTWPTYEGEHRNGNNADNRFDNLRDATRTVNSENLLQAHSDNKSGLLGVSWSKDKARWYARIRVKGAGKFLGYFSKPEAAYAAYLAQKRQLHEGNLL